MHRSVRTARAMKLLWFTWKDLKHPMAGGAEVVNEELAKRLATEGHEVVFVVGGFSGGEKEEVINGYRIIRLGNRYTLYWIAYRYYKKHLTGWADLVIDEVNTMPFFARFYVHEPSLIFIHMLARRIWFYQMFAPLNLVGYLIEPLYLRFIRNQTVLTISQSSKDDLLRHGFTAERIHIISEGIELEPVKNINTIQKYASPTLLSLGTIRPMKRTHHQIRAYERAKQYLPELRLKVAGDATGRYGRKVLRMIQKSRYADSIDYLGRVSQEEKIELMQRSHAILVTSIKEGWGLIVTEAASQGTVALAYDVDGLRDSVRHERTGLLTGKNTPEGLADTIVSLFKDKRKSVKMREQAWQWSHEITFDQSYQDFKQAIGLQ